MEGHDEWELFTQKDIDESHAWYEKCQAWRAGFVKSRRKEVWAVHLKPKDFAYACQLKLFGSKEAAEEYLEQLLRSDIGKLYSYLGRGYHIEKLPIYKCHKEVEET